MRFSEKIQYSVIDRLFHSREDFSRKVKEALDWSKQGGPKPNSPHFVRAVVGQTQLSAEDFRNCLQEIFIEVGKIEQSSRMKTKSGISNQSNRLAAENENNYTHVPGELIQGAQKLENDELMRSGGINPNEI